MATLLTPKQVARELAVSKATVYKWIVSGELQAVRIGKRAIRVDRQQLSQFLLERTCTGSLSNEQIEPLVELPE